MGEGEGRKRIRDESREVDRGYHDDSRRREERRPREEERYDPRRAGGSSYEARRGDQGHEGRDERGDFSGRAHDVKQEAGEGSGSKSGGSKPREASSYKEWKEQQQKKKSSGQ